MAKLAHEASAAVPTAPDAPTEGGQAAAEPDAALVAFLGGLGISADVAHLFAAKVASSIAALDCSYAQGFSLESLVQRGTQEGVAAIVPQTAIRSKYAIVVG
jgi:hypothetical protein